MNGDNDLINVCFGALCVPRSVSHETYTAVYDLAVNGPSGFFPRVVLASPSCCMQQQNICVIKSPRPWQLDVKD